MNKNGEQNKEKRGIFELIGAGGMIEGDLLPGGFRVEMRGRNALYMQGCRRILKYSESEMVMAARDFDLKISGRMLTCSSYHFGNVTVEGEIVELRICEKEG